MPIYEYKCRKCGKQFDAFQSISDPELKSCKFCRGKVNKLVSLSSFSLKGSGWYATDYGGKKAPASSPATSSSETAKVEKSATGSESTATETTKSSKED
jgi:putative FmdB family regulatory protein